MSRSIKIRTIILKHHLGSFVAIILVFAALVTLISFDAEDQALEQQIKVETEKLTTSIANLEDVGRIQALNIDYYLGIENLPGKFLNFLNPDWTNNFYEITTADDKHYHIQIVETEIGKRLYVVFDATNYLSASSNSILYLQIFAFFAAMLIAITAFSAWKMSRRISHPLEKLSANLLTNDKVKDVSSSLPSDIDELNSLDLALRRRDEKIQSLIDREHQFNRDMSHELRTPLAVASGALEILANDRNKDAAFERLTNAMNDMTTLTEGVLWLAREPIEDEIDGQYLAQYCEKTFRDAAVSCGLNLIVSTNKRARWPVPASVAKVILSNLVRNSLRYTQKGNVEIAIGENSLIIRDTGIGFGHAKSHEEGFGIGLSLTRRLCAHYNLAFDIAKRPEGGTQVNISWEKSI